MLPFTHEQFLDVFGRYNQALWPVVLALWLVSAAALVWLARAGRRVSRAIAGLLAFNWAWSGIAYHVAFFTAINPAAWLFAALFLCEAAGLLWLGIVRGRLQFSLDSTPRRLVAIVFVAYSFLYPAINLLTGHSWPRAALFGVPCPTTLFTVGLLLAADPPLAWSITFVPILWALVGGSAASLLDVPADFALFAAAVVLTAYSGLDSIARLRRRRSEAAGMDVETL